MANLINTYLRRLGLSIEKYPKGDLLRRMKLLKSNNIDMIFDIGANEGQYAQIMRRHGYMGDIVSFEPLSASFKKLEFNSKKDDKWLVKNYAIGDKNENRIINIAGNSGQSSSFWGMTIEHVTARSKSAYVGAEDVIIKTLDTVLPDLYNGNDLFVKIDTQGFEKQVLSGAENSLKKIKGIQVELSLLPLYEGASLYLEIIAYLNGKGFELFSIEPGFINSQTGRLLQFDGIFMSV
jgi:FkbM family methyltransferase